MRKMAYFKTQESSSLVPFILVLLVTVPFLGLMIFTYVYFTVFEKHHSDVSRMYLNSCNRVRVAALLQKQHEDDPSSFLKIICNGVVFDKNIIKFPIGCFPTWEDDDSKILNIFVTTGSDYWTMDLASDFHTIQNITKDSEVYNVRVYPEVAECVFDERNYPGPYDKKNVPRVGWNTQSRTYRESLLTSLFPERKYTCHTFFAGSLLFDSQTHNVDGMLRVNCWERSNPIKISNIHKSVVKNRKNITTY